MEAETVVNTEKTEECQPETSPCNKKMLKFMRFSLSMEDTELKPSNPQPEQKEEDIEEDCYDDVFHSRKTMSFSLMADQESDADNPFCKCDLISDDSEIVPDTANIAYISEQIWRVIKEQQNLFLKTLKGCKYIASKQNKICLENTMSAKINIFCGTFLGKVTDDHGVPVMLNFTGTKNFLCCTRKEEEMILIVTVYDIENRRLSADHPEKSLIFYMSQKRDGLRYFESALHRGWFIHAVNDDIVKMQRSNSTLSSGFTTETTEPTEQ